MNYYSKDNTSVYQMWTLQTKHILMINATRVDKKETKAVMMMAQVRKVKTANFKVVMLINFNGSC